jgi:hypothetical protein
MIEILKVLWLYFTRFAARRTDEVDINAAACIQRQRTTWTKTFIVRMSQDCEKTAVRLSVHLESLCPLLCLAHDLHYEPALSGSNIKIDEEDLLPCAECEIPIDSGDCEGRSKESCAQMRMAVAVSPSKVVSVISVRGSHFVHRPTQIIQSTGFIFNGCDGACG